MNLLVLFPGLQHFCKYGYTEVEEVFHYHVWLWTQMKSMMGMLWNITYDIKMIILWILPQWNPGTNFVINTGIDIVPLGTLEGNIMNLSCICYVVQMGDMKKRVGGGERPSKCNTWLYIHLEFNIAKHYKKKNCWSATCIYIIEG